LIALVLIVVGVLLAMIAPILAQIIQLAVSRQREYLADATAVELTRYPQGLANALRKIDEDPAQLQTANRGTAHLYIANPVKKFEDRADSVFASHPPMQDRIRRLEALVH
jgi:heat shock protein HtpX